MTFDDHDKNPDESKENNHISVNLWGSGKPLRDFLFVDDLADAVIYTLENKLTDNLYNIGSGNEISIKELAKKIQKIVGHKGEVIWDESKPDGAPRKIMDISKIKNMGWTSTTELNVGIEKTYKWFLNNINNFKEVKF